MSDETRQIMVDTPEGAMEYLERLAGEKLLNRPESQFREIAIQTLQKLVSDSTAKAVVEEALAE